MSEGGAKHKNGFLDDIFRDRLVPILVETPPSSSFVANKLSFVAITEKDRLLGTVLGVENVDRDAGFERGVPLEAPFCRPGRRF